MKTAVSQNLYRCALSRETLRYSCSIGLKILSPRVYLFDEDNDAYFDFRVVGKEFSFDVDMTKLPCGTNGALYLDEMRMDGDSNEYNTAGPKYGTGYCDAQCPQLRWVEGKVQFIMKL